MQKEKITIKMERAIVGLIETGTIEACSKRTSISKNTLRKYMQKPAFVRTLRDRRNQTFDDALERLKTLTGKAVDRLTTLLKSDDESTARLTARIILVAAFKGVEVQDFEDRLSRIEEIIKEKFFIS